MAVTVYMRGISQTAWLAHDSKAEARSKCIKEYIPYNSNEAAFIDNLPHRIDAFVLRWNQGELAHKDRSHGHAVHIRLHPATEKWYLLDSENRELSK